MASFPTSVFSPTSKSNGQVVDASHLNDLQAEVTAIEGGYINGTARLNSSNLNVLGTSTFAGNIGMASTAVQIGSSSVPVQKVFCGAIEIGGATMTSAGAMTLLKAGSGTDTTAAATNVDTIAITGLTAKDTLVVYATIEAVTQAVARPVLQNSTDGVTSAELFAAGNMAAGDQVMTHSIIRQRQGGATLVGGITHATQTFAGAAKAAISSNPTFTQNWTGSWTLALRHGGVTAGGTFQWSWTVYKVAGQ